MQVEGELTSALHKARWRLLPVLAVGYLIAFVDRSNISFAAESMGRALHLNAKTYGLGAGLFFVGYALCEIPSNLLLLRFGARRWLARIMCTWGLLAMAMAAVRTPQHFYWMRFLLGCAEAGFFPGTLYFLSQWFPRGERARAITWFYISLPLSNLILGGLAGVLLGLQGKLGLAGWQWMFLLEGAPAVLLSAVLWIVLRDTVSSAAWLSGAEKSALTAALQGDSKAPASDTHGLAGDLRSWDFWAVGLSYFVQLATAYALLFSIPLLLGQAAGWDAAHVGYLVAAFGILACAAMAAVTRIPENRVNTAQHVATGMLVMALGLLLAAIVPHRWPAAAALLLVVLSFCLIQSGTLKLITTLSQGRSSAITIAMANMCGLAGGFLGPVWMGGMRTATGGYAWGTGLLALPCACAAFALTQLKRSRLSPTALAGLH